MFGKIQIVLVTIAILPQKFESSYEYLIHHQSDYFHVR